MSKERWFTLLFFIFYSCTSDTEEGLIVSDATILSLMQNESSFLYYKNNLDTLKADPSSPHFPFVRIRFNPKARSAMNDSLSKLTANVFPDESMIVKEIYSGKGGTLLGYSVMYKLHNAANNGSGWVWSEINPDGSTAYSTTNKGDQCVSCHSSNVNADLVRTFSLH